MHGINSITHALFTVCTAQNGYAVRFKFSGIYFTSDMTTEIRTTKLSTAAGYYVLENSLRSLAKNAKGLGGTIKCVDQLFFYQVEKYKLQDNQYLG